MKQNKLRSTTLSLICSMALILSGCADQTITEDERNESNTASETSSITEEVITIGTAYIINMNTKKFHYTDCPSVEQMNEKNKREFTGDRNYLVSMGYSPCHRCEP